MVDRQDKRRPWRGVPVVVTAVAMAMVAAVAGGAQAAPQAAVGPAVAAQAPANTTVLSSEFGRAKSRVEGTFNDNPRTTVTGTFTPRRFKTVDDGLVAVGKLRATLVRGNGRTVGSVVERIKIPVTTDSVNSTRLAAAASCDILNLVLGPLDLDLLGLEVHLDKVVLKIIATPGPGNLLGNLLCAVAGLLDTPGLLTQVTQILNAIIALLRM